MNYSRLLGAFFSLGSFGMIFRVPLCMPVTLYQPVALQSQPVDGPQEPAQCWLSACLSSLLGDSLMAHR